MEEKVTITTKYYYELLKKENVLNDFEEWCKNNDDSRAAIFKYEIYGCPLEVSLVTLDFILIKLKEFKEKNGL